MQGWTLDLFQAYKNQDADPRDFDKQPVKVLYWSDEEGAFAVHFTSDDPDEYFYCAAMFMEELACHCTSQALFNFGCRCGAVSKKI